MPLYLSIIEPFRINAWNGGGPLWLTLSVNSFQTPDGQQLHIDERESDEHRWQAVDDFDGIPIQPPTMLNLRDVIDAHDRHGSVRQVLRAEAGWSAILRLPQMGRDRDIAEMLLREVGSCSQ